MIMKSFFLLLLSASVAVGHVAQIPRRDLIVRAGQGVENLDNEPDYEDPVSGDKTPKSRILTGLGPDAAINRFFDWDESCTDEKHRKKIAATFANVLTLTGYASGHLDQLSKGLNPQPGSSTNKRNQQTIFDIDPAYAQMFLGLDNQIKYVKGSFDLISGEAPKPGADRGGNKPGALRFICNADDHVMNGDGSAKYCGSGAEAAQAIATTPYEPTKFLPTIEPRYSFETSSSVTFCPKFFDDGEFPNVDVHAGSNEQTLDKIDCAERILLHEYMHLPWIRNMPGNPDKPDVIGYFNSAEYARKAGWGNIKVNPDNYAWFALYAYFNNNNNGCGADVWPGDGSDKPNKKPR